MRSFAPKILALASIIALVPLANAYAARDGSGALDQQGPIAAFQGPRIDAVLGQVDGVHQGIADALQGKQISQAEASRLDMRVDRIRSQAERVSARDDGRVPAMQYHALLHRIDNLNQRLNIDTGHGFSVTD